MTTSQPPPATTTTTTTTTRRSQRASSTSFAAFAVAFSALVIPEANAQQTSNSPPRPFGYQSDSTHSVEFRAKRRGDVLDPAGHPYLDPSSYVGSVTYDPLHHALYVIGQTYASGPGVFDGVDVYELKTELADLQGDGDPLWWEAMATGLRPHLGDLGVPKYGPRGGDCYYSVLALPMSGPNYNTSEAGGGVDNLPGGEDSGGVDDVHRVKLLHSRRFGSDVGHEGCSAVDVLLPSVDDNMEDMIQLGLDAMGYGPGGFFHDFEHYQEDAPTTPPPVTIGTQPPAPSVVDPFFDVQQPSSPSPSVDGGRRHGRGRRILQGEPLDPETYIPPPQEFVETRSVRLLMAGHVESPDFMSGYVVSDLENVEDYSSARVYAFAQQVDVRLPAGDIEEATVLGDLEEYDTGKYDKLDYMLHSHGTEEDELAQELESDFKVDVPKDDFLKIITSGVESRALLNSGVEQALVTVYPVGLVADSTTKRHFYVMMIASESLEENANPQGEDGTDGVLNRDYTIGEGAAQRAWTDYPETGIDAYTGDYFGVRGRPNFGNNYRIILKKMSIELNASDLTNAELALSGENMDGNPVTMRHGWVQEFRPDGGDDVRPTGLIFAPGGDIDGTGDVLIMVGTTAGKGSAFGTADDGGLFDSDAGGEKDLDGFITKIHADDGTFAGDLQLDISTNNFQNTASKRISSIQGRSDIVASVCAVPLRAMGIVQEKMEHVYVVGSTSALVPAVVDGVRSDDFLSRYPVAEGSENEKMEAFLMKIDLSTMNTLWTVQVGAIVTDGENKLKGSALGYGCAVTRDGEDVYLTGLVKENGVVTDFSDADVQDGVEDRRSMGGTDVFVSSYKTDSGVRNFLKQVGSTRDDFPSRGSGGITTDRLGNAIITGHTRGSLMRSRSKAEFIYGPSGEDAAMDIFIMSLDRLTFDHIQIATDTTKEPEQEPAMTEEEGDVETDTGSSGSDSASGVTDPGAETVTSTSSKNSKKNTGALVGIIAVASVFIILSVVATVVVIRRIKKSKRDKAEVTTNSTNLHGSRRHSDGNMPVPQRGAWRHHNALNPMRNFNPDVKVEVRNSASGGWHGVYDEDHLQSVDFGAPGANDGIVEQSLFMEDEVREIEDNLENYVIGETDNDVSDEDLIKAYNAAMAVEIEPESPEVEFAMSGVGSSELSSAGKLSASDELSLSSVV
ncbi:hypothetical protein ACHAXA_007920 [Cyclostephanos tholiformis]|uniref:Uncharacterized protein n=1 Tax=Cyclostephanos tholiformis TaxID=382380 RepID=A0ABD3SHE9_9STRA